MFHPLRPLKLLPWIQLLQIALVTVLLAIALDLLIYLLVNVPMLQNPLLQVLNSPAGELLNLAYPIGVGIAALTIMERGFKQVMITAASLWALVACIGLWLGVASLVRVPTVFLPGLDIMPLALIAVGMFWKGRRYWRWG